MNTLMENDLWIVSEELKNLQRKVDDAEWEGDVRLTQLARELEHFKSLNDRGVIYEPKF